MSQTIKLTYIGKRFSDKKLYHAYQEESKTNSLLFSKRLYFHGLGCVIECTRTDKGVSGPYKVIGHSGPEKIKEWSITEVADEARHKEIKDANKVSEGHVDALIETIRKNTFTYQDRKRVAMYIFNKLTT